MIKNFLFVLKRFKTSSFLNMIGLSVAFAVFILIMMQVIYDYTFDKFHPDNERIFRVDFVLPDNTKQAIFNRPMAESLFQSSPYVVAGALSSSWVQNMLVNIEKSGSKFTSVEKMTKVSPSFTQVFPFDILDGTINAMDDPDGVLIPQSLALKLFGN